MRVSQSENKRQRGTGRLKLRSSEAEEDTEAEKVTERLKKRGSERLGEIKRHSGHQRQPEAKRVAERQTDTE